MHTEQHKLNPVGLRSIFWEGPIVFRVFGFYPMWLMNMGYSRFYGLALEGWPERSPHIWHFTSLIKGNCTIECNGMTFLKHTDNE